jgi:hypothetical protein
MFIDQILRRNCMYDEQDVFEDIVEAHLKGGSNQGQQA